LLDFHCELYYYARIHQHKKHVNTAVYFLSITKTRFVFQLLGDDNLILLDKHVLSVA